MRGGHAPARLDLLESARERSGSAAGRAARPGRARESATRAAGTLALALAALQPGCAGARPPSPAGAPAATQPPSSGAAPATAPAGPRLETGRVPLLLVVLKLEDSLAIVDPASFKVISKVKCGGVPHQVVVSGPRAFVSNYGSTENTITVVDLATRQAVKTIDVRPLDQPHGLYVQGGELWFTAERSRTVARYNPATERVEWCMGIGRNTTHMLAVTKDGRKLYTADVGSGGITVLQPALNALRHVPTGNGAEGIAFTPDEKELWVTNRADSTIAVVSTRTDTVIARMTAGPFPVRVAFTPDGKRALVSNAYGRSVSVWDVTARREIQRVAVGEIPIDVLVTPDGKRAFVACARSNEVCVIDLSTYALAARFSAGFEPEGLAWAEVMP